MAFVLELSYTHTQPYMKNFIISIIRRFGIKAEVRQMEEKILCAFESGHSDLQRCLQALADELSASCFMTKSDHYTINGEPETIPELEIEYPLSLGICPSCQKEMFDPSSRRYYYPFIHCNTCGGQYGFLNRYPYIRANTSMSYLNACPECLEETRREGKREKQVLVSCHQCAIPVRLVHGGKERYANDAGSFRTLFEVAAKALRDQKRLLMKSTFGYRLFTHPDDALKNGILMFTNGSKVTEHCSMILDEFNALISIERPILNVALKSEPIRTRFGNSAEIKFPDEGFSILLAKELIGLGIDYIVYHEADEETAADFVMDFDIPMTQQSDMRLFINQDLRSIISGERVAFPSRIGLLSDTLSIASGLVGIGDEKGILFDKMEHFASAKALKVNQLVSEEKAVEASNYHTFANDEAAFMSVIAEHRLFGIKTVGAHFEGEPSLLYYDGKKVIRVVPPVDFQINGLLNRISTLRDGSARLIENLKQKNMELYNALKDLESTSSTLFETAALILGLEEMSYEGVAKEALKFIGKGGLQVDTKIADNRFNHDAFLASLISYRLAGVESVYLSYSIFESFGDYFSELLNELKGKTKATEIILCGSYFAGQSLFSRIQRNLKGSSVRMNGHYPIGKENCVVGGAFL